MTSATSPTVVVELTPPGRAAIAVVLVSGPDALRVVADCFVPATTRPLASLPSGRIALGRWIGPQGEELIVCRPAEEQIEIHCHGGIAAVRLVIEQLVERGCVRMSWQDWLRWRGGRVSPKLAIASRRDAATCAARIALAEAPTARAAAILLDQYHGALTRAMQRTSAAIAASDLVQATEIVHGVLQYRDIGLHLTTPWRVVVAGAPNVGKSSLVNALAGFQRAIVSPLPGTTRDVVTITTAIDGWPVQLVDTAGLRPTHDELETAGIALADAALAEADLVVMVSDASAKAEPLDEVVSRLPRTVRILHVWNKIDLVPSAARARLRVSDCSEPDVPPPRPGSRTTRLADQQPAIRNPQFVSAVTGEGVAELVAAIGRSLVPVAPPAGAAVAFTLHQVASMEAILAAIGRQEMSGAQAALAALLAR